MTRPLIMSRPILDTPTGSRVVKVFWTLLDQGAFTAANFMINVLFARWLTPIDYGWFVLSFSVCMFVTLLHWGSILEPLLVQSAKVTAERARPYIVSLIYAHLLLFAFFIGLAIPGFLIATHWFNVNVGLVIVGGMVGAIALNTLSTGRRLCSIFVSARTSAVVGVAYLTSCAITAVLMHNYISLGWFDVWLIIGSWSVLGSIATFGLAYHRTAGREAYPLSEVFSFAQRFFHWGLVSTVCSWIRSEGLYVMLAHYVGLHAVAETRAVFNLGAPAFQANMAVHLHTIVEFSADREAGSKRNIWRIVSLYAAGILLAAPVAWYLSPWVVRLFYSGRYLDGAWQLPIYCLVTCLQAIDSIVSSFFKANGTMFQGYLTFIVTAVVSLLLGPLLIPLQGTLIWAMLIATAIGMITALTLRMRAN